MKFRICRLAGQEPKNLRLIREAVEAIPGEGCVMLDLHPESPCLEIDRKKDGGSAFISLPLVPAWLHEPELAGKLMLAVANFIASLHDTEEGDRLTQDPGV